MLKIAIVTPVKDEIGNLPKLISAMESQSMRIFLWVIIENDSTDGSKEYLDSVEGLNNVDHVHILNLPFAEKKYQLGLKYSTIIKHGFDFIESSEHYNNLNYIGILDADCHPEAEYYSKLIRHFEKDSSLGIGSGIIKYHDNTIEKRSADNAIGGCRLWRIRCFNDSPYEIGMSADSISSSKAVINGWTVRNFNDALVISRQTNVRYKYTYPGYSAYYRHIPFFYILLKSTMLLLKGYARRSAGLFIGYIQAALSGQQRLQDEKVKRHYKNIIKRKVELVFKATNIGKMRCK